MIGVEGNNDLRQWGEIILGLKEEMEIVGAALLKTTKEGVLQAFRSFEPNQVRKVGNVWDEGFNIEGELTVEGIIVAEGDSLIFVCQILGRDQKSGVRKGSFFGFDELKFLLACFLLLNDLI